MVAPQRKSFSWSTFVCSEPAGIVLVLLSAGKEGYQKAELIGATQNTVTRCETMHSIARMNSDGIK